MKTNRSALCHFYALGLGLFLAGTSVQAQFVTLLSSDPANQATGVPVNKEVVFRFSDPMDQEGTTAMFMAGGLITMQAPTWEENSTVMKIKPATSFSPSVVVTWYLVGTSQEGEDLFPLPVIGTFTTAQGGSEPCTNYVSSFTVAKGSMSEQTGAGPATLYPEVPFAFLACAGLACTNQTATNLVLTVPAAPSRNENMPPKGTIGTYSLTVPYDTLAQMDTAYPNGNYVFKANAPTFSRSYTMAFPANLVAPAAPHISNFAETQTINPNQDFVLRWDAYSAHSSAGLIYVEVYGGYFKTPMIGEPGALNGSQPSVTIPAGTLSPNSTYTVGVTFYDYVTIENTTQLSLAYRSATTELDINTTDGSGTTPDLRLINPSRAANTFTVELDYPLGHYLEFQVNTAASATGWSTLYGTNTPGGRIRFTDPAASSLTKFYRVQKIF